jgi:hypothetical protein
VQTALAIARDIAHTVSSLANSPPAPPPTRRRAGPRSSRSSACGRSRSSRRWSRSSPRWAPRAAAAAGPLHRRRPRIFRPQRDRNGPRRQQGQERQHRATASRSSLRTPTRTSNIRTHADGAALDRHVDRQDGRHHRQADQRLGKLFDTSKLKLGTSGKSGFLGLFGGSSTTKSLYDLGIKLNSGSVADIIANGIGGSDLPDRREDQEVERLPRHRRRHQDELHDHDGALDPQITAPSRSVILSLRDGLVAAANVIGLDGARRCSTASRSASARSASRT